MTVLAVCVLKTYRFPLTETPSIPESQSDSQMVWPWEAIKLLWTKNHWDAVQLCWRDVSVSPLLLGTNQHQGHPTHTNQTFGTMDLWVNRPTSWHHTLLPPPPSQVEEGKIISAAKAPHVPPEPGWDPVPHWAHTPGAGAFAQGAWFTLCHATTSVSCGSYVPQLFSDYSNAETMKESKKLKEKKLFSRLRNFFWCNV